MVVTSTHKSRDGNRHNISYPERIFSSGLVAYIF